MILALAGVVFASFGLDMPPVERSVLLKWGSTIYGSIMMVGAELHADQEALFLEMGSHQKDLWGINLYPLKLEDWIEFDSMINLRPSQGNFSRGVDNPDIQKKIIQIVCHLVIDR